MAGLLVRSGCIEPGYAESMLAREQVANTYLGKGIAIPHGLPKDRELIQRTGIAVLQVPDGVAWQPGDTARLVVGIAARSDEHSNPRQPHRPALRRRAGGAARDHPATRGRWSRR